MWHRIGRSASVAQNRKSSNEAQNRKEYKCGTQSNGVQVWHRIERIASVAQNRKECKCVTE